MSSAALPLSPTLNQRVAADLRLKIAEGEFSPGERLSERMLSESLGISRNTLREVFRTLANEGLIKHEPNRGVFVAIPSMATIIDIYRVRRMIECQALAQAYPRHPARARMREALETALRCYEKRDWIGVGTANTQFHTRIVELADSERINLLFASVLAELRLAFGLLRDPEFLHGPFVQMNRNILELAEADEFARSAAALNDYLVHSERLVLGAFARNINGASKAKG